MNRRDFLRGTVAAAVSSPTFFPALLRAAPRAIGPNDRVVVGLIGPGGRAHGILEDAPPDLQVVALADCDLRQPRAFATWMAQACPQLAGPSVAQYQDYRRMFEKEKLDAVIVATTTHARALICIHAMQAGLDVYAEKPLTLTIEEGWHLIKAERKYKSVLQVGTQQRSIPLNNFGSDLVRGGAIGKVHTVLCTNFIGPEKGPALPGNEALPEGLDWDMWCHQTELVPYSAQLHPGLGNWGRWRAYDGGGLSYGVTGWGTHAFDQVQRALGTDDTTPAEIWPEGTGPDCPVFLRYPNGTLLKMNLARDESSPGLGGVFLGEKGKIEINRNRVVSDPPELVKGAPEPDSQSVYDSVAHRHLENWIECMRNRRPPNAGAEIGHRSSVICHLINICRELARPLRWDPAKEEFIGDEEANRLRSRARRKGYELPSAV